MQEQINIDSQSPNLVSISYDLDLIEAELQRAEAEMLEQDAVIQQATTKRSEAESVRNERAILLEKLKAGGAKTTAEVQAEILPVDPPIE
jgi:hypothetical protein